VTISGTSFATPLVASVAALIRARFPNLSAGTVDQILCDTARDLPNWDRPEWAPTEAPPECGLVDAEAVLQRAMLLFSDDFETGDTSRWSGVRP
jgi:subtilisin family serine protease